MLWAVGVSASPVTVELLSFNGFWQNGYPYTIELNHVKSRPAMCDDYYHDGTPGDIWLANLTSLGRPYFPNLRFASYGLVAYREVAWILLETAVTPSAQWPDMNFAVWHIFNPTVVIDPLAQFWIAQARAEAARGFPGVNFFQFIIATPINIDAPPTGDQEFIFEVEPPILPCNGSNCLNPPPPPASLPEPSSFVLLASGVAGVATWAGSRSKR
jgi:hypothetical protein